MDHMTAKDLSLFFFYLILDEKQALFLASEAHDHYIKDKKRSDRELFVIKITQRFLKKIKIKSKNEVLILKSEFIKIKADLEVWSRFIRTSQRQDVAILVWHYQLGYSIEKISQALNLSISTVQMRLSKATTYLGELIQYQLLRPVYEQVTYEKKFSLAKYENREMTEFHALGMVWDYVNDNLNPVEKKSFQEAQKKYPKIKEKIEFVESAIEYLKEIKNIEIEEYILKEVEIPTSYFDLLVEKTKADTWPDSVKWIMEAFLVSVGVTFAAILIPWGKVNTTFFNTKDQLVTIVSMEHQSNRNSGDIKELETTEQVYDEDEAQAKAKSESEQAAPAADDVKPKIPEIKQVVPPKKAPAVIVAESEEVQTTEEAEETGVISVDAATNKATTPAKTDAGAVSVDESSSENKKVGFLFRGSVTTANIPVASLKIKEKIESLGGRKAANAELGWRNSPTTSYFHFTIPESKYDELVEFLQTYGEVKILKEKHSKVMPEGIIRLIVQAEEPKAP